MNIATIAQFAFATLLPAAMCALLTFLRRNARVASIPERGWQVIVGIAFGLIAIYGTEAGIPVDGAMMNVRDAAPLAAGLLFGGPAGIIAGVIGGVERWLAVMWGVGAFTQAACSLGTIFAGVYAAVLRKFMFERHIPNLAFAFALGVTAVYAKKFASMAGTDPDCYSSDIHSFGSSGTTRMVDSVSSMANSIGSTMSSSPSSGSGGGSFSGGGGGGGSGGGSW